MHILTALNSNGLYSYGLHPNPQHRGMAYIVMVYTIMVYTVMAYDVMAAYSYGIQTPQQYLPACTQVLPYCHRTVRATWLIGQPQHPGCRGMQRECGVGVTCSVH